MKKVTLRSLALTLAAFGLADGVALAAAEKDHMPPKVDMGMMIRGRYSLWDSTRKTNFDFFSQTARLNARYTDGMFSGFLEGEFFGNATGTHPASSDSIGVRQAWMNLNFVDSDDHTVGVTFGRFMPTSADTYGNDALTSQWSTSGFQSPDGLMVHYKGHFGFGSLNAQLAMTNGLPLYVYDSGTITGTTNWLFDLTGSTLTLAAGETFGMKSRSESKAYIANVSSDIELNNSSSLEVVVAYGMQKDSPLATVGTTDFARDVGYLEASVGYNYEKNFKAGVWYTMANLGETKSSSAPSGAPSYDTTVSTRKDTYTQIGLGAQGNSKLWGVSDLLQNDDMLVYGAGVQMFQHRQTGAGALSDSDAGKNDVTMFTLGGGYAKGLASVELNYAYFTAENKVFFKTDRTDYDTSAHALYLVGLFAL